MGCITLTKGRGRAMDLLTALSQSVVEDFSPYKLSDLLKDKGAKGKITTQTKHMSNSKVLNKHCLFKLVGMSKEKLFDMG